MHKYLFETLFSVLFDIYPEVGLLDHGVILFLISEATPYCSIVPEPLYSPTKSAQNLQPVNILGHKHLGFFFNSSHPNRCEVNLICGFDLHFSDD